MKCKLEECTYCRMNHYTGLYECTLYLNEEVDEDYECEEE